VVVQEGEFGRIRGHGWRRVGVTTTFGTRKGILSSASPTKGRVESVESVELFEQISASPPRGAHVMLPPTQSGSGNLPLLGTSALSPNFVLDFPGGLHKRE